MVVNTFVRIAPDVIDAEIEHADGTKDTLTGTPNHPFWVPAVRDYVPLGKLEVGTELHVQGGGEAVLVSKTWRQGEFEVFDFEVEGLHNFYVRGEGSDAAGVLVHNSTAKGGTYKLIDPEAGGVKRTGRTNDLARREGEHARSADTSDLDFQVDRRTDVPAEQRGREQVIHDAHPEARHPSHVEGGVEGGLNKKRPISPNNKRRDEYMEAAKNVE
jgi:hypothetical protein